MIDFAAKVAATAAAAVQATAAAAAAVQATAVAAVQATAVAAVAIWEVAALLALMAAAAVSPTLAALAQATLDQGTLDQATLGQGTLAQVPLGQAPQGVFAGAARRQINLENAGRHHMIVKLSAVTLPARHLQYWQAVPCVHKCLWKQCLLVCNPYMLSLQPVHSGLAVCTCCICMLTTIQSRFG